MKILCWNARSIRLPEKRKLLKEVLLKENIDIICLQETKKTDFTKRFLNTISVKFNIWKWLPANGTAGGIMIGLNSNCFSILSWYIGLYSITVGLINMQDNNKWALTVVYGPTNNNLRKKFWAELDSIQHAWKGPWVVCGDFNIIKNKSEKKKELVLILLLL